MHNRWIESMLYNNIPADEWEPFYEWYCKTHPDGLTAISVAYTEWKATNV